MNSFNLSLELKFKLLNGAHCVLDSRWNYSSVVSPFSRLYLVTAGHGVLLIGNQKIDLLPGNLYLIPSYINCSYYCEGHLEKYYLHFTNSISKGMNIFDMYPASIVAKAEKNDYALFERLLKINPGIELRVTNPEVYHRKPWLNKEAGFESLSQYFETNGIIQILLSKFFDAGEKSPEIINYANGKLKEVLMFIDQNLSKKITIEQLSEMVFLSSDHFTRSFKKIIGITPTKFITNKRIEKSQLLLITSTLSLKEVVEKCGFNSVSFFNRMFKINTGLTPLEYRKKQIEVLYHGQK